MADPISWMVVSAVASVGISYMFPSEGPRMKDMRVSASTYGSIIPEVFGTCRVGANMIWNNPIREQKKKKKQGKGGGYYNEYSYFCDFAMGLCVGPVMAVRRLWADGKLIYDTTGTSEAFQSGKYRFRVYLGGEDQLPDSLMEASKGVGNVPAYRGLCYVIFENAPLKDFGNRLPQMAAEVYRPPEASGGSIGVSTELDPLDSATLTSFAGGDHVVDLTNGFIYLQGRTGSGLAAAGIRRFRIGDGKEDQQFLNSKMNLPVIESIYYQANTVNKLLAVDEQGGLIVSFGGLNNYSPIARLDPVSMTTTAVGGRLTPFGGQNGDLKVWANRADPSAVCNGMTLCHMGQIGNGDTSIYVGSAASLTLAELGTIHEARGVCAGDEADEFWIVGQTSDSLLTLAQVIEGELHEIATLSGPELEGGGTFIQAESIAFDTGSPGPLLMVRTYNAGSSNFRAYIVKWSKDTQEFAWHLYLESSIAPNVRAARITNGEFGWVQPNGRMYAISTETGQWIDRDADAYADVDDTFDPDDGSEGIDIDIPNPAYNYQTYDGIRNSIIVTGTGTPAVIRLGFLTGDGANLAGIVGAILRKGSLGAKDFDLSALTSTTVKGYGFASATDIKSVIDELKKLYLFDLVESNGRLTARLRSEGSSSNVNAIIPQDVLGSTSPDAMDFWTETRLSEADLPERVTMAYMNIDDDFETSTAASIRVSNPIPTMFSRQQIAMQVNLVATPTEAKNIVHKILYTQWMERTKHETRLPWAFLDLDPSDTIKVEMNDGRTYFDRLHVLELGANYSIEVEAYGQDSGAYEATTVADGGGAGRTDTVTLSKPASVFVLNTPLLRDSDDTGGGYSRYYSAVGQVSPGGFAGATVFRSTNSLDFAELYSETSEVEWGVVTDPLPPPPYGYESLDWVNTITVRPAVTWFDVESITDDELWNGANLVLVGDEAVQFRDAVENADGTWTLSNLLRGRRGTEYACNTHVAGERFIFLDAATIEGNGDDLTARGQVRSFKAVASGQSLVTAPTINLTYEPRDLMPYAPADIRREIADTEADSDITLTWARRTRLGGNMVDGTGTVNLAEADERYEVFILNTPFAGDPSRGIEPAAATVVRSFQTTTPSVTYTAAMQAEDGHVTNVDTLHVVIYQLSGAVGRGFPGARSIPAFHAF